MSANSSGLARFWPIDLFPMLAEPMQTDELREALEDWTLMRKELRHRPWVEVTVKTHLRQWHEVGPESLVRAIRKTIMNGYMGLFLEPRRLPVPKSASSGVDDLLAKRKAIREGYYNMEGVGEDE